MPRRILRVLFCVGLGLYVVFFLWAAGTRMGAPQELQWTAGVALESVDRIAGGQPLYVEPSDGFIPLTWAPGYLWAAAALHRIGVPALSALRGISALSTIGVLLLLGFAVWRSTGSRFWAAVAVGLYLAVFGTVGAAQVHEQPEALASFLVLAAVVVLLERTSMLALVFAGALFAGASLVKLPAVLALVGAAVALRTFGQPRKALALCGTGLALLTLSLVLLHHRSAGWSTYYTLYLPFSHGLESERAGLFLGEDLPRLGILLLLGLIGAWAAAPAARWRAHLLLLMTLGVLGMAALSYLHQAGQPAELLPICALLALSGAISAAWWEQRIAGQAQGQVALLGALCLQLGLLYGTSFRELSNGDPAVVAHASFRRRVLQPLEAQGKTWVFAHAHESREPHPHQLALWNVMRAENKRVPPRVADAVIDREFAAIVVDDFGAIPQELRKLIEANYFVSDRVELSPWERADPATAPQWILKPRRQRMFGLTPESTLEQHAATEMLLAQLMERMRGDNFPDMQGSTRMENTARLAYAAIDHDDDAVRDALCMATLDRELCRALWQRARQRASAAPAERIDHLREVWSAMTAERASWVLERKALLAELACLRQSEPGASAVAQCFALAGGGSPTP
jgi:hypothetical protein